MYASVTVGRTAAEIRPTRTIRVDGKHTTIRVRPGRGNTRRAAILASLGYSR
ncbi:hypothetical protein ACVCAH_11565 [Micromonospora sp. LZ34]